MVSLASTSEGSIADRLITIGEEEKNNRDVVKTHFEISLRIRFHIDYVTGYYTAPNR